MQDYEICSYIQMLQQFYDKQVYPKKDMEKLGERLCDVNQFTALHLSTRAQLAMQFFDKGLIETSSFEKIMKLVSDKLVE